MTETEAIRRALLRADPKLSRFDPLERIIFADDFDEGLNGWAPLYADYDGFDDTPGWRDASGRIGEVKPVAIARRENPARFEDRSQIMLTSLSTWDAGSIGSSNGTYALKVASPPKPGTRGYALKRVSCPWWGKLRFEAYFTFKADHPDYRLGHEDVHSLIFGYDLQDFEEAENPTRWRPFFRYLNAAPDGTLVQRWQGQFDTGGDAMRGSGWTDIEGGYHELPYNRSPTKYQWLYIRYTVDLAKHEYVDFFCHGKELNVKRKTHSFPEGQWQRHLEKCSGLLNVDIGIHTNSDKRCFLFLDSIVLSAEGSER
ncbi:MAG: hypothetical protein HY332_15385 [Chloroflexi bacterium]|nr:hypothetical protein [Chloroflexota bacterium]